MNKKLIIALVALGFLYGWIFGAMKYSPAPYKPPTVVEAHCQALALQQYSDYLRINGVESGDPYVNDVDYPKKHMESVAQECVADMLAHQKKDTPFTHISVARAHTAQCDAIGMKAVEVAGKLAHDQGFGWFQADGDNIYLQNTAACNQ